MILGRVIMMINHSITFLKSVNGRIIHIDLQWNLILIFLTMKKVSLQNFRFCSQKRLRQNKITNKGSR